MLTSLVTTFHNAVVVGLGYAVIGVVDRGDRRRNAQAHSPTPDEPCRAAEKFSLADADSRVNGKLLTSL